LNSRRSRHECIVARAAETKRGPRGLIVARLASESEYRAGQSLSLPFSLSLSSFQQQPDAAARAVRLFEPEEIFKLNGNAVTRDAPETANTRETDDFGRSCIGATTLQCIIPYAPGDKERRSRFFSAIMRPRCSLAN